MDDFYAIAAGASSAVGAAGYAAGYAWARWRGKRQQKIAVLEQRLVDLETAQDLKLLALEKNVQTMVVSLGASSNDLKGQLEQLAFTFRKQTEQLEARLAQANKAYDARFAEASVQLGSAVGSAREHTEALRVELRQSIDTAVRDAREERTALEAKLVDLVQTQSSKLHALEKSLASSNAAFTQSLQAKADADKAAQEEVAALQEKLAALKADQDSKRHDLEKAHGLKLLSNEKDIAEGKAYSTALEVGLHGELRSTLARIAQANALHDEGQKKRLDEVVVELNQKLIVVTAELNRKLSSGVLERTIREVLEPKSQEPTVPELEVSADLIKAAIDEQERREGNHPLSYRDDQRVQAVQQRLSRDVGERAFGAATRFAIVKELKKRDMV